MFCNLEVTPAACRVQVFERAGWQVVSIDIEADSLPTICCDILDVRARRRASTARTCCTAENPAAVDSTRA